MQVVPVIDIRGGAVVHAQGGDRDGYRPIVTPLAEGCDPIAVVAGFRKLFPFPLVYVADLDGIIDARPDMATVRRLSEAFADVAFLVDNGAADADRVGRLIALSRVEAVAGSETLACAEDIAGLAALDRRRVALSLTHTHVYGMAFVILEGDPQ